MKRLLKAKSDIAKKLNVLSITHKGESHTKTLYGEKKVKNKNNHKWNVFWKRKPNVLGEYSEENFGVLAGKAKKNKSSFWKGLQEGGCPPPNPRPAFFDWKLPALCREKWIRTSFPSHFGIKNDTTLKKKEWSLRQQELLLLLLLLLLPLPTTTTSSTTATTLLLLQVRILLPPLQLN